MTNLKLIYLSFFIHFFFSFNITAQTCDCPKPSREQFMEVCGSIYEKESATAIGFQYKYQELLWTISCADIKKDSPEVAKKKIQCMWEKYRTEFRCYEYSNVSVPDSNVLKFAMDTGFSTFLVSAVKKYNLNMNFKDPADGKTILDFLKEGSESYRKAGSVNKANEYDRIYELLVLHGTKHSNDL